MNDQSIIRLKRGSTFLLISVIAQRFLFLSKDFGSFLSPVFFDTIFVLLTSTSLSSAGWCNCVHMPVFLHALDSTFQGLDCSPVHQGQEGQQKGPWTFSSPSPSQVSQHHVCSHAKCLGTHSLSISDGASSSVSVLQDPQCEKTQRNSQFFSTSVSLLMKMTLKMSLKMRDGNCFGEQSDCSADFQELNVGLQLQHRVHKSFPCQ